MGRRLLRCVLASGLVLAASFGTGRRAVAEDAAPAPAMAEPPKGGEGPAMAETPATEPEREARGLAVGTEAPPIEVAGWVNVPDGQESPTRASLKGKVVYLEFWATTCGPCVRTMGKVQGFHDRYRARGLVVLGISPDPAFKQTDFAAERGLGFPLGIDPGDTLRQAYRVDGIPTSYVVGADGKISARTHPSDAEDAIDRALGLHAGATGPLDDYLAAVAAKDAAAARFHLERQIGRAVVAADLAAWAKAAGGASPADPKAPVAKVDGTKTLADLAKARAAGDAEKGKAVLDALAAGGPAAFDLSAWARDVAARDFPVTAKELKDLADRRRYDALVDAIVDRKPPSAAMDGIVKLPAVQEMAAKGAGRERGLARKALMILLWPLADKPPKDEETNTRFWRDLGSSGWVEDATTRRPIAMDVEGTMILKDSGPAVVERWLSRAVVMDALAAGKKPDLSKLRADVTKARAAIEKQLHATYD